ncbi:hypothetical protein PSI15_09140 [Xenorhabdus sp. PR6a]|uniref:hypothetical protein n=1 Tax=Xenorhabdus sp. PR6a TaxID=3025877 RepID=UPI002358BF7B|nr:hypothetical protein [Xenorhabdus sp. PR6a]MDC9581727.1 hypothetical protein [Xenorhabdus sp. PR6a]
MSTSWKLSVPENSDLIAGQLFELTVTLDAGGKLPTGVTLSFLPSSTNIKIQGPSTPILMQSGQGNEYAATLNLTIPDTTPDNTPITLDLQANNAAFPGGKIQKTVKYTAHIIDPASLVLTIADPIQDTPKAENIPPSGSSTQVSTTLKSLSGTKLSGVPVFITNDNDGDFSQVNIYDNNTASAQKINTTLPSGSDGFTLLSDSNGMIAFYIYPIKGLSLAIKLYSQIIGATYKTKANSTCYIIDPNPNKIMYPLRLPKILILSDDGDLVSDGSLTFLVRIDKYLNATAGDNILFYVNGQYTKQQIKLKNKKQLGSYTISLPYSIFNGKENQQSIFSYVVISSYDGSILPSDELPLTYKGGVIYEPVPYIQRDYDTCTVMTSAKTTLPQNSVINYVAIRSYPNSKDRGLFIEILGDKSGHEKGKVPIGAMVTLNMYISSANKNPPRKSLSQPMPASGSLLFNIDYHDVVDIAPYDNGAAGSIEFDYQFTSNTGPHGEAINGYGKIWEAGIDTVRIGVPIGSDDN